MKKDKTIPVMAVAGVVFIATVLILNKVSKKDFYKEQRHIIQAYSESVSKTFSHPEVISALKNKNNEHETWSLDFILELDRAWRNSDAELLLFQELLKNDVSQVLLDFQDQNPSFAEIFITDKWGCLLGLTNKTSDYYQADEAWWVKVKEGGNYTDEIEFDKSAHAWVVPIYHSIKDSDGSFLGVMKSVIAMSVFEERAQQN